MTYETRGEQPARLRGLPRARRSDPPIGVRTAGRRWRAHGGRADEGGRRLPAGGLAASLGPEGRRPGAGAARRAQHPLSRGPPGPETAGRLARPLRRLLARPVRRAGSPARGDGRMTEAATESRSIVVERTLAHPPEKVWR